MSLSEGQNISDATISSFSDFVMGSAEDELSLKRMEKILIGWNEGEGLTWNDWLRVTT